MEGFMAEKSIDYPRDPETQTLLAAIHPQLQVLDISESTANIRNTSTFSSVPLHMTM